MEQAPVVFRYQFTFPGGEQKTFTIELDPQSLQLRQPAPPAPPAWTRLSHHQCANCPLAEARHPHCPAALSLIPFIDYFSRSLSIEQVDVRIESGDRQYAKRCSLQEAASSLMGLYMATSGCPVMAKLRPMVRFHLPFATFEETRYRVLSMYLLAQYLLSKRGGQPDWAGQHLLTLYQEVRMVNEHFSARLRDTGMEDASLNAIVRLDAQADAVAFTIDQQMLQELEALFQAYLGPAPAG